FQVALLIYSAPGRSDHHTLIACLAIVTLGCGLRLALAPFDRTRAILTGLAGAAAVWVSVESLLIVALVYLILVLEWIHGRPGAARKAAWMSAALALGIGCAILIERSPAQFLVVEHDKVSWVHEAAAL